MPETSGQQQAAASAPHAQQDSEQQSAATSAAEESYQANAAQQALSAPLTRAKDYLSGSNYAVGYPTAKKNSLGFK